MSKKILVADDSLTIQKVIELTFMDGAHEVTTVSDGQEAIDHLVNLAPDIVIADVHMPGLTGLDVCRRVKESTPGLPVLLLVGTFEPFEMDEAEKVGADAVLRKPFDSQELMEQVERLLSSAGGSEADASAADTSADAEEESAVMEHASEEAADDSTDDTSPTGIAAETEVFALPDSPDQPAPSNWGFQQEAEPFRLADSGQAEESAPVADPWQELGVAPRSQEDSTPDVSETPDELDDEAVEVAAQRDDAEADDPSATEASAEDPAVEEAEGEQDAAPAVSERAAMAWKPQAVEAPAEEEETAAEDAADSDAEDTLSESAAGGGGLSDADVERIAQRVAEIVGQRVAKDVAWEVIPDLAEVIIKDRLRELEAQVE